MSTALLNLLFAQVIYKQLVDAEAEAQLQAKEAQNSENGARQTPPLPASSEFFLKLSQDLKNHPLNSDFNLSAGACQSLYNALFPQNPTRPTGAIIQALLAKLYESYKRDIVAQIRNDENQYHTKLREIEQIENGKMDKEILKEQERDKAQALQRQQLHLQRQLELQQKQELRKQQQQRLKQPTTSSPGPVSQTSSSIQAPVATTSATNANAANQNRSTKAPYIHPLNVPLSVSSGIGALSRTFLPENKAAVAPPVTRAKSESPIKTTLPSTNFRPAQAKPVGLGNSASAPPSGPSTPSTGSIATTVKSQSSSNLSQYAHNAQSQQISQPIKSKTPDPQPTTQPVNVKPVLPKSLSPVLPTVKPDPPKSSQVTNISPIPATKPQPITPVVSSSKPLPVAAQIAIKPSLPESKEQKSSLSEAKPPLQSQPPAQVNNPVIKQESPSIVEKPASTTLKVETPTPVSVKPDEKVQTAPKTPNSNTSPISPNIVNTQISKPATESKPESVPKPVESEQKPKEAPPATNPIVASDSVQIAPTPPIKQNLPAETEKAEPLLMKEETAKESKEKTDATATVEEDANKVETEKSTIPVTSSATPIKGISKEPTKVPDLKPTEEDSQVEKTTQKSPSKSVTETPSKPPAQLEIDTTIPLSPEPPAVSPIESPVFSPISPVDDKKTDDANEEESEEKQEKDTETSNSTDLSEKDKESEKSSDVAKSDDEKESKINDKEDSKEKEDANNETENSSEKEEVKEESDDKASVGVVAIKSEDTKNDQVEKEIPAAESANEEITSSSDDEDKSRVRVTRSKAKVVSQKDEKPKSENKDTEVNQEEKFTTDLSDREGVAARTRHKKSEEHKPDENEDANENESDASEIKQSETEEQESAADGKSQSRGVKRKGERRESKRLKKMKSEDPIKAKDSKHEEEGDGDDEGESGEEEDEEDEEDETGQQKKKAAAPSSRTRASTNRKEDTPSTPTPTSSKFSKKRKRASSPAGRSSSAPPVANRRFLTLVNPLISNISSNKSASFFANPVNPNDAPNYYDLIYYPTDLRTIKAMVKDGRITNTAELERELQLMFANAVMYNGWDSDVSIWTREMQHDTETLLALFRGAERTAAANAAAQAQNVADSQSEN